MPDFFSLTLIGHVKIAIALFGNQSQMDRVFKLKTFYILGEQSVCTGHKFFHRLMFDIPGLENAEIIKIHFYNDKSKRDAMFFVTSNKHNATANYASKLSCVSEDPIATYRLSPYCSIAVFHR